MLELISICKQQHFKWQILYWNIGVQCRWSEMMNEWKSLRPSYIIYDCLCYACSNFDRQKYWERSWDWAKSEKRKQNSLYWFNLFEFRCGAYFFRSRLTNFALFAVKYSSYCRFIHSSFCFCMISMAFDDLGRIVCHNGTGGSLVKTRVTEHTRFPRTVLLHESRYSKIKLYCLRHGLGQPKVDLRQNVQKIAYGFF